MVTLLAAEAIALKEGPSPPSSNFGGAASCNIPVTSQTLRGSTRKNNGPSVVDAVMCRLDFPAGMKDLLPYSLPEPLRGL